MQVGPKSAKIQYQAGELQEAFSATEQSWHPQRVCTCLLLRCMQGVTYTFDSVNSCTQAAPGALLAVYCSAHAAPVAGNGPCKGGWRLLLWAYSSAQLPGCPLTKCNLWAPGWLL